MTLIAQNVTPMISQYEFLMALSKEINCRVDPDLVQWQDLRYGIIFIGSKTKGWVHYFDSATVLLQFPRTEELYLFHLEAPTSLEQLEKVFHG